MYTIRDSFTASMPFSGQVLVAVAVVVLQFQFIALVLEAGNCCLKAKGKVLVTTLLDDGSSFFKGGNPWNWS